MRYHLTSVGRAITKKKKKNCKCWQGYEETGTLVYYGWKSKIRLPLRGTEWNFLKILKSDLPNKPAIYLLGVYSKELKLGSKETAAPP